MHQTKKQDRREISMEHKKEKVLLGMSGGTDSSVAALLLQEQGFEVIGVTFRFYEKEDDTTYLTDARELAERIGITHITYDARTLFKEKIVSYFIDSYLKGETPVPCTLCNNYLKWPLLAQLADERGIERIATGHYVRCMTYEGQYYIYPGLDPDKDQSFFLWSVPQAILKRMELPLGTLTKVAVRALAAERGFAKVATKKDSLGVCFCPGDYRTFLKNQPEAATIKAGFFEDETGKIVGKHTGFPYYTVGQRRGLGVTFQYPVFVKETNPLTNRVVLAPLASLYRNDMYLTDWHLTTPELFEQGREVICKIRYRKQATPSVVTILPNGTLHVRFLEPLESIAAGQAAAFYESDRVVGGGIILPIASSSST